MCYLGVGIVVAALYSINFLRVEACFCIVNEDSALVDWCDKCFSEKSEVCKFIGVLYLLEEMVSQLQPA